MDAHDTDPVEVDQALILLLGGEEEMAAAAAAVANDRWPGHGALTAAAVAAARWGVDLLPALQRLADGEQPRGSVSEYEWRFGSEEASDDLETALRDLALKIAGPAQTDRVALPLEQPEVHAARAARDGIGRWDLSAGRAGPPMWRCRVLAEALGVTVTGSATVPEDAVVDPPGVASTYTGFGVIRPSWR